MIDFATLWKFLVANAVISTAIGGLLAWVGKVWADRRLERLKADHIAEIEDIKAHNTTQLERFRAQNTEQLECLRADLTSVGKRDQAGIDRQMLVFRTHFDVEYKNYLELWAACDRSYDLAAQALQYFQLSPVDGEARKEGKADAIRDYDLCREALADVRRRRPFIQQEVCDTAVKLLRQCVQIRRTYNECYSVMHRDGSSFDPKEIIRDIKKQLDAMKPEYEQVARLIAARVQSMYVAD